MAKENWNSDKVALLLEATVPNGGSTASISVQLGVWNNFSSTVSQPWTKLSGAGYGEHNKLVVRKIPSYTFTISCYANVGSYQDTDSSSIARLLRALLISRNAFKITVVEREALQVKTKDFSFQLLAEYFDRCYVSSKDISYPEDDVPVVTFTCVAYRYANDYVDTDGLVNWTYANMFGDGRLETGVDLLDGKNYKEELFKDAWESI